MTPTEWRRGDWTISTDRRRLDRAAVHEFLRDSYWARNIPRDVVDRAIEGSLCFGLYDGARQVGFARVISDLATFAYLADVFVIESHRGRGLAAWLLETIRSYPDLQNLRRWMLATQDAHGLYRRFGFTSAAHPERLMEIVETGLYSRQAKR